MAAENHRVGFLVRFFQIVNVWPQSGFLQAGIDVQGGRIAEFIVDLIGDVAIVVDALLQPIGDAVQRIFFLRQPGVGLVVAVQANGNRQQHGK